MNHGPFSFSADTNDREPALLNASVNVSAGLGAGSELDSGGELSSSSGSGLGACAESGLVFDSVADGDAEANINININVSAKINAGTDADANANNNINANAHAHVHAGATADYVVLSPDSVKSKAHNKGSSSRFQPYGINFPLCLAPMVGLTHVALRLVMREYLPVGAQVPWPTEMLNSRRLPNEKVGFTPETFRGEDETFLVPQILGNEEKPIAESVKRLEDWGAQGIDINMGCPVQKALRHNYGVALMGDASYAAEVVRMASQNTKLPVSVKLRAAGTDGNISFLLDFVKGLRDSGASWVCLHPRTAEQKRRGSADWSQIRALRDAVDFPVVGNGDVQTAQDAYAMIDQTGCDLVMSGRGLAARPWMFWQMGEDLGWTMPENLQGRQAPRTPIEEGAEYGRCLLKFIDLCEKYFGPDLGMRKVRFYIRTTSCWLLFGQSLISVSTKSKNFEELRKGVETFFAQPQEMSGWTDLRQ